MIGGNTVVAKPASESPVSAYFLWECLRDAGLPDGVFNLVVGPASQVGEEIRASEFVDGIAFTGSYDVGMYLYRNFGIKYPKPVIAEMGGKNPVIITENADLDAAAEGVARGAFGFSGQNVPPPRAFTLTSASRANLWTAWWTIRRTASASDFPPTAVRSPVLSSMTKPFRRGSKRWTMRLPRADAVVYGGNRILDGELKYGYYVQPTIVDELTPDHRVFRDELFVPFIAVQEVESVEEGVRFANDVQFGLTAGIFSQDEREAQVLLRQHSGGRDLLEPSSGRDHRRMAPEQYVRRVERQRLHRTQRVWSALSSALYARTITLDCGRINKRVNQEGRQPHVVAPLYSNAQNPFRFQEFFSCRPAPSASSWLNDRVLWATRFCLARG